MQITPEKNWPAILPNSKSYARYKSLCTPAPANYPDQGWNYRLVIDNRWRYSLLFFYQISIRLYFLTIDFQTCAWPTWR